VIRAAAHRALGRARRLALVVGGALAMTANPTATAAAPDFLLQNKPERLEPFRERPLQVNPPTFRWPTGRTPAAAYRLELARDPDFREPLVEVVRDLWFRPREPLAPGTWYWRCRPELPESEAWLGSESFELPADLPRWSVPEWGAMVARIPSGHPRVYLRPGEVPALQAGARKREATLAPRRSEIRRALAQSYDLEPHLGRVAFEDPVVPLRRREIIESKFAAIAASAPAVDGAWLWVATGDAELLPLVKRRALQLADFDPAGFIRERNVADSGNVDFGNSHLVHQLGVIYDLLHAEFTPDERRQVRAAIVSRARPVFAKIARCSQELMRAHAWQHGFLDVLVGAIAVHGEEPVVEPWIETGLKAFVAFYPWFGGNDGGSQEGVRYFHGQEMMASFDTVEVFDRAFGLRLDEGNPWFRASPYFLIYGFPPGGAMARLGDNNGTHVRDDDDLQEPNGKSRLAALRMAELYRNGHAAAYAARLPQDDHADWSVADLLRFGGGSTVPPLPLDTLPAARCFHDIGAVMMHSVITRPDENVRLVFHCSPYGAHGHAHADQNSFHVIAYGEDLLLDSGYYPAFNNADPHRLQWSVQTKAHNSVLVDSTGQSWGDARGYGRIAHFEQQADRVYVVGSAERASREVALERFDRHLLWLRGRDVQTYVVLDDLAAVGATPRRFDWLLHAARRMEVDAAGQRVTVRGEKGVAVVTFLGGPALSFHQDDQFDAPAFFGGSKSPAPLPNQWHLKATPPPAPATRFIAVVQVARPGTTVPAPQHAGDTVILGDWQVTLPPAGGRLSVTRTP
jgi:hypothetical protein